MPNVLLTGGAGYIGSHTCVEVIAAGAASGVRP
jgi:UDP-glucose 4-epimerase